jgi:hypothetical protein
MTVLPFTTPNATGLTGRERVRANLEVAVELVDAVHRQDPADTQSALDRADLTAVALVLAGMVDEDRSVRSLLRDLPRLVEAVDGPRRRRQRPLLPHGTHAAFERHRRAGEPPCTPCITAERGYQRSRPRVRAAAATPRTAGA